MNDQSRWGAPPSGESSDERNPYFVSVAAPAGAARPPSTGLTARTAALLALVVAVVAAVAILNLVKVGKVVYHPGPVYDTLGQIGEDGDDIVTINGLDTYPTSGTLDFTTITVQGGPDNQLTAWDWLMASLDSDLTVVDQDLVYPPDTTQQQVREQNLELMSQSQQGAVVVALREIGVEVPEQVKVAQIVVDAPAGDTLQIDDQIVTVGGVAISNGDDIRDELQNFEPGTEVPFELIRDGEELTVDVPTGPDEVESEDGTVTTRTVIGVYLASDYEMPYDITIDAGNVGGPSAGLMFSLAIYDKITEGELTGGLTFAGTGTINSAGDVGAIGGIQQKLVGASDAGADYFLAPASNCNEVVDHVPGGLTVIAVSTFDQARDAVESVAAGDLNDLPTCEAVLGGS